MKSSRARPLRSSVAHDQLTRSGTIAPTARDSFSTQARCRRSESPASTGTQIWMPRLPVTFGQRRARSRCSSAVRWRSRQRDDLVERGRRCPGRGRSARTSARSGASAREVHAWCSITPKFAIHTSAGRLSTTKYQRVVPALARLVVHRAQPLGCVRRHGLVPEARLVDAVREPVHVDARSARYGTIVRRDRRVVADEVALGEGRIGRRRAGNSTLSRLVSLSVRPPTSHSPLRPARRARRSRRRSGRQ